jgi:uncharacterized protein
MNRDLIQTTAEFVRRSLENAEAGHDWWHIFRVWNTTKLILKTEKADPLVCELGALLHDIADHKFHEGDETKGAKIAGNFLRENNLDEDRTNAVTDLVLNISFKGGIKSKGKKPAELQIVQDADRLDAMGAIGIARAFQYGGHKNRKLYDPEIPPRKYKSVQEYIKSDAPTINHFNEKLLLLKDLMNTETGKKLAEQRHAFMLEFLDRFFREWGPKTE